VFGDGQHLALHGAAEADAELGSWKGKQRTAVVGMACLGVVTLDVGVVGNGGRHTDRGSQRRSASLGRSFQIGFGTMRSDAVSMLGT